MDRLRQLWDRIVAQLGVLSVSQRLAIGLSAALVAVSLMWLVQWSTTPEMVPLVTQDFDYDGLDSAEAALRASGIPFETRGIRLYVRVGDRPNAIRLVHSVDALPDGSLFDMNSVVSDSDPFQSPESRKFAENYAKGNELAKIITTYPFVKKASVVVNPVTKRRLGGHTDVPTASVSVTLSRGKEMSLELVDGFAKLVAGAVAGLKPYNVNVTDARTGRSYSLPRPGDMMSLDVLGIVKRYEEHFRSKILETLGHIPGVRVAVSVELDTSKRVTTKIKLGKPQLKKETSRTQENSSASAPTEAGVQANTGQALTAGQPGQTSIVEDTTTENFEPRMTQTEKIEQMPFSTKKVTATVRIPRSFVVGVFRAQNANVTEPPGDDDPAFIKVRDAQTSRVRLSVEKIVMAEADSEDVNVDVYPDMDWTADGITWSPSPAGIALAQQGSDGFDALGMLSTYGPQAGLAALALLSLVMMVRMGRKPHGAMDLDDQSALDGVDGGGETLLPSGTTTIGQAESPGSLLVGQEVDPETLRFKELGEEVSHMVTADPEGAANLVRRWIEADE